MKHYKQGKQQHHNIEWIFTEPKKRIAKTDGTMMIKVPILNEL